VTIFKEKIQSKFGLKQVVWLLSKLKALAIYICQIKVEISHLGGDNYYDQQGS
jgi:hypothetical protein